MNKICLLARLPACVVLVIISLGSMLYSQTKSWEWTGLEGGRLTAIVQHPTNRNVIFGAAIGYPSDIFKSTDHGQSWNKLSEINGSVSALTIHPVSSNIMYANLYSAIAQSSDGGASWPVQHGLDNGYYAYKIALDPTNANIIHASGYYWDGQKYVVAYMKSTNAGVTWIYTSLSSDEGYGEAISVERACPQHIAVGGYIYKNYQSYGKVFISKDGGQTWGDSSKNIVGTVIDLVSDPVECSGLYAATYAGVYRTTNEGSSWIKNTGYLRTPYLLAVDPMNTSVIYAAVYDSAVYKSTDRGLSWRRAWSPTPDTIYGTGYYGIFADITSPGGVFFANNVGVFQSSNGGTSWHPCNSGLRVASITALRCNPTGGLFVGFEYNAVYKTPNPMDATPQWIRLPEFYSCYLISDIAISTNIPDKIYTLEGGG